MADNRVFSPKSGFVPVLKREEIDIMACIKAFDTGCEHIYIVDNDDIYTGKVITKEAFLTSWQTGSLSLRKLGAIPLKLLDNPEALARATVEAISGYENCRELPITIGGSIVCVANGEEKEPEAFKIEWGYAEQYAPAVFKDYKKVFVSSLENEHVRNFFYAALPALGRKLMPLRRENLQEAMSKGNLLVFGTDIYPPGSKCHILYVHGRLNELASKDMESRISISRFVPCIKKRDWRKPAELIRHFDEGNKTVVVEEEGGEFFGVVVEHNFAQHFPGRNYPVWGNIMVPYDEDEDHLKHTIAAYMVGTARQAVPVVKDGKAVVMASLENFTYRNMTERELRKVQSVNWAFLSLDTVRDFFADMPKVLISSLTGNLKSFYNAFHSILDITVYKDDCLEDFLAGDYDMLLYEADLWGKSRCAKLNIEDLYLLLVKREVGKMDICSES